MSFTAPFLAAPAVLTAIQTMNNEKGSVPRKVSVPFLNVAVKGVSNSGMNVGLERAEAGNKGEVVDAEMIGYVAMEAGAGQFMAGVTPVKYAAVLSKRIIPGWGRRWKPLTGTIPFGADLGTPLPLVMASQSSRYGGDGGWVRVRKAFSNQVKVTIDEDNRCDKERKHTKELVSVFAFSSVFVS